MPSLFLRGGRVFRLRISLAADEAISNLEMRLLRDG